jgi:hypothetical protein
MGRKAHSASIEATKANQRALQRALTKGWAMAAKAPMYCEIKEDPNRRDKHGHAKMIKRTKFNIGGDAYRIAASGAAGENVLFQTRELARIGLPVEQESALAPWAPSVSLGAKMQTDEFMRVVAQQARRYATVFMKGINKNKRLNKTLVRMGFELAKQKIFTDTAPGGRVTITLPTPKPKSKASGKAPKAAAAASAGGDAAPADDDEPTPDGGGAA